MEVRLRIEEDAVDECKLEIPEEIVEAAEEGRVRTEELWDVVAEDNTVALLTGMDEPRVEGEELMADNGEPDLDEVTPLEKERFETADDEPIDTALTGPFKVLAGGDDFTTDAMLDVKLLGTDASAEDASEVGTPIDLSELLGAVPLPEAGEEMAFDAKLDEDGTLSREDGIDDEATEETAETENRDPGLDEERIVLGTMVNVETTPANHQYFMIHSWYPKKGK